jgi:hypothetical protein
MVSTVTIKESGGNLSTVLVGGVVSTLTATPVLPANESNYVANDNTGGIVAIINADTSTLTISTAKAPGSGGGGGTPSPTVAAETVGASGTAGSSGDFQRGDHVHSMPAANESNYVSNDNTGNLISIINADTSTLTISTAKAPGTGGSSGVQKIAAGTNITISPTGGTGTVTINSSSGSGSFPALFAPTYHYSFWFDGTNYHMRDWSTGTDTYSGTGPSTILAQTLNASTASSPTWIDVDASINMNGIQTITYGSAWYLWGGALTGNTTGGLPQLGQLTIGASGHSTTIERFGAAFCNFQEMDFLDYATIQDFHFFNIGMNMTGQSGGQGIIFNNGIGSGGIQYGGFWGNLNCINGNGSAVSGQALVTFTGSASGVHHLLFDKITSQGNASSTSGAPFYYFLWQNGAAMGRLVINYMDLNTNGSSGYVPYVFYFAGGSSVTAALDVHLHHLHWEQHCTNAYVIGSGQFTGSGAIQSGIVIDDMIVSGGESAGIFNNSGAQWNTSWGGSNSYQGPFIDIKSLASDGANTFYLSGSSGSPNWGESAFAPIHIGGPIVGQQVPLNTGDIIATPVSGSVLSVGGTGFFSYSTVTVYTVGGTRLTALLSGTVVINDATNTRILGPTAVTNLVMPLSPEMKLMVYPSGSAVFWKAE